MSQINQTVLTEMFNRLDMGIILIDENNNICFWNEIVSRHSQRDLDDVYGNNLFEVFPTLPQKWLSLKFKGVRQLQNTSNVTWEQRPVLFEFSHGGTMLQNCSFIPVPDGNTGEVNICITIVDVSDFAKDKIELKEMIKINKSFEEISNFDALTDLYNRRYIMDALKAKLNASIANKMKLSLLFFDLDHFKSVNDTYGHIIGDRVLKYVSETVSFSLIKNSEFGRYGGEEFIIYFSNCSIEEVLQWAEEIREKIAAGSVRTREGNVKVTASFGVAEFTPEIKDDLELIHNADVALYRSKDEGRNRVSLYTRL